MEKPWTSLINDGSVINLEGWTTRSSKVAFLSSGSSKASLKSKISPMERSDNDSLSAVIALVWSTNFKGAVSATLRWTGSWKRVGN